VTARPDLTRPLILALSALILVASILPPETSGVSLAGCALLVALATAIAATMGRIALGAWALVASVPVLVLLGRFGVAPGVSVEPIAVVVMAMAAFVAASAAAEDGLAERLAAMLAVAGAAVGARAIYEIAWGLNRLAAELHDHTSVVADAGAIAGRLEQGRAYAGFPTPAAAGGFLVLALCATVPLLTVRSGRQRLLLLVAATIQAAGLLSTRSLTAAAALLVALTIAFAASRSRRIAVAAAALFAAIALVGALRAGQVFSQASDDNPWRLRAGDVRIGLAMAAAHPWLGVGPGGYAEAFPLYRRLGDNESRHAHCLPLELVAELGFAPGLAAATLFFLVFLGPLVGGIGGGVVERGVALGLGAFALHNLSDFTAFLPSVLWIACVARGALAHTAANRSLASQSARLAWSGCVLLAAAFLVCSGMSAEARQQARQDVLLGDDRAAAAVADRAVFWAPWSVDAALLRAQARFDVSPSEGNSASAESDADRAVFLAPSRAAAREVRARLRARNGDVPGAFADFSAAAALHPARSHYAERKAEAAAALPRPPDEEWPR